jgi:two-component system LytT family sensor kinase
MLILVVLATVLAVAFPIKIWNSARIEHRLRSRRSCCSRAKIESLQSQINPHFLFNTLTSISSLIRAEPDTARTLIISCLRCCAAAPQPRAFRHAARGARGDRRVPRHRGDSLRAQAQGREGHRSGHHRLIVPSMILQPLVENSIKHGFSRKVGPGSITISSHREHGRAVIEVEDDGMGFLPSR